MVLQLGFVLCLSIGNKFRDFYYLSCFSVYFCSCCFCSGFQNFAGNTCSWDFQVINWFTEELCPISAWRNPTQDPVFLLSEPCSPGAHLWMSFAFVFLGKYTKVVRVIILFLLYWLLLGTFCLLEKIPLALYSYVSPLAFVCSSLSVQTGAVNYLSFLN